MAQRAGRPTLVEADVPTPARRNRVNLFELAYQRIEEMLVRCELPPGRFLTMLDLQAATGFGRTPIHHAVNRLAADTLIVVRPRHGLQIAPIDLARERVLLHLRRDIERFVIRLAAERAGPSHRNQMLHMERLLRENEGAFCDALYQDFRKPPFEHLFEITVPLGVIDYYRRNLAELAYWQGRLAQGLAQANAIVAALQSPIRHELRADFDSGDGLHPNDAGMAAMAEAAAPAVSVRSSSVASWPLTITRGSPPLSSRKPIVVSKVQRTRAPASSRSRSAHPAATPTAR